MSTPALTERPLERETSLSEAVAIWQARLENAGLDNEPDEDELDAEELRLRDEQRHHARRTVESYATAMSLFLRWCEREGRRTLGELLLDDPMRYTRTLRRRSYDLSQRAQQAHTAGEAVERLAARTVHGYVRPVLGFLALADSFDAITFRLSAAQAEVKRALPRMPDAVAPQPPDLRRLVAYYDNPHNDEEDRTPRLRLIRLRNAALLHVLFSSAARISEALSLDVGDVCRDRRVLSQVTVYGKGRREGTLFLRRAAERSVKRFLEARGWPAANSPLFASLDRRTAGSRLSRISGWRIVTGASVALANQLVLEGKADEAALLRETSPHTFRHFVGYHLLNEGVELAEVSQILRHRSIEVTRKYYAIYRDIQLQEVHDQFSADPFGE